MTDYTKLIERLRDGTARHDDESRRLCNQAAEAIEALQGECAEHKENAIRNARQAVAFRAERDALQAKLDELQKQEPVAWIRGSGKEMLKLENGGAATVFASEGMSNYSTPLYAAPKAQQPLTEQTRWDLFYASAQKHGFTTHAQYTSFARAIEAAHGITKGTPT